MDRNRVIQILLIEDNPGDAQLVQAMLEDKHQGRYSLQMESTLGKGLEWLSQQATDVVLLDLSLPDSDGLETLARVNEVGPDVPVVILTGLNDTEVGVRAVNAGAQDYLIKSFEQMDNLFASIQYAMERHHLAQQLRASEKKFRSFVKKTFEGIVIINQQGVIQNWNPAMMVLTGMDESEVVGELIWDVQGQLVVDSNQQTDLVKRSRIFFESQLQGAPDLRLSTSEIQNRDGRKLFVNASFFRLSDEPDSDFSIVFRDVTELTKARNELERYASQLADLVSERTAELQEAQEKLLRREKLAALGQMAGGIAHELRNPLGVVTNAISFLKMRRTAFDEKTQEYMDLIEAEVHRSVTIISDLTTFSRVQGTVAKREQISLSDLVDNVLSTLHAPPGVTVVKAWDENLPTLWIDPRQIDQVVTNLILNAYHAMRKTEEKTLTVRTFVRNENVCLTVRDTGHGISEKNQTKLFEPLFTTKIKGIGLGLSVSKTLIEGNGGTISVESEGTKGAEFTLSFPLADRTEGDA